MQFLYGNEMVYGVVIIKLQLYIANSKNDNNIKKKKEESMKNIQQQHQLLKMININSSPDNICV